MERWQKLMDRPQFVSAQTFGEEWAIVQSRKPYITINKPFQVGAAVLDWSKAHMYQLWYDGFKRRYGDACKLVMMDTDSFIIEMTTPNVDDWEKERDDLFDRSKYPPDHPMYSAANAGVLGLLKNEKPEGILEVVCLSPKVYCILSHKADGTTSTSTRAKGISRREVERMTIDQYRVQITDPHLTYIQNHRIFSYRHSIDSRTIRKAGLVGYDTKRVLCADKINSLAFGHYSIQVAHLYDAPTAQGHDLVLRWEERAATAPSTKHWRNGMDYIRRIHQHEGVLQHFQHRVWTSQVDFVQRLLNAANHPDRNNPDEIDRLVKFACGNSNRALLDDILPDPSRIDPDVFEDFENECEDFSAMLRWVLDEERLDIPHLTPSRNVEPRPADWRPPAPADDVLVLPCVGPLRGRKPPRIGLRNTKRNRHRLAPNLRDIPTIVRGEGENEEEGEGQRRRRNGGLARGLIDDQADDDGDEEDEQEHERPEQQGEMDDFIVDDDVPVGGEEIHHAAIRPLEKRMRVSTKRKHRPLVENNGDDDIGTLKTTPCVYIENFCQSVLNILYYICNLWCIVLVTRRSNELDEPRPNCRRRPNPLDSDSDSGEVTMSVVRNGVPGMFHSNFFLD